MLVLHKDGRSKMTLYHYVGADHLRGLCREAHCISPASPSDVLIWAVGYLPQGNFIRTLLDSKKNPIGKN